MIDHEIIAGVAILAGATRRPGLAFGVVDLYTRRTSAKAATLGATLCLVGAAALAADAAIMARCLAAIGFLVLTAPAGAHLIARAGYRSGESLAERTASDELANAGNPSSPSSE